MSKKVIKPIVKWAGGKGQLISEIQKRYPYDLGTKVVKYAEPMVGGGAVLFDILSNFNIKKAYISDTNAELINVYKVVKNNVDALVEILLVYEEKYWSSNDAEKKALYYDTRKQFNDYKKNRKDSIKRAALFIFLNRTCFNGLYRVNANGEFNVPMGKYKHPTICDEENLRNVSRALKKVSIVCKPYFESEEFIDKNTFVYFDPPYRPLTATASFTAYTEGGFSDGDQKALCDYIGRIRKKGANILLSNSDPHNTNKKDDFFDDLYEGYNVERVKANRMINRDGSLRGKITELLIRTDYKAMEDL